MPSSTALRWSAAFHALSHRAAHEIRNPLNAAVVNLEVVRQRVRRPNMDAGALAPFADAAASELARATELLDALLALARPAPTPVDLARTLRPLGVMYSAIAAGDGGSVTVEHVGVAAAESDVDAAAARLVLATVLDTAVRGAAAVHCTIGRDGDAVLIRVRGGESGAVPGDLRNVAAEAGIQLECASGEITIRFPASRQGVPTSGGKP